MEKLYGFLEKLCRGNAIVQQRIFDNLDLFLTMDGSEESDKNLALVLTQVCYETLLLDTITQA